MPKSKIRLDELDIKLIADFPFIVDVFVTTMAKIQDILAQQYEELKNVVSKLTENKKNWKISSKGQYNGLHKPFFFTNNKQILIDKVIPYYRIESTFDLVKGNEKEPENRLCIWIAFEYDADFERKSPILFYIIAKWETRKWGVNYPYSFYEKIKKSYPSIEFIIEHPERNFKHEFIQVNCSDLTDESIDNTFNFFLDKILTPYLQLLK